MAILTTHHHIIIQSRNFKNNHEPQTSQNLAAHFTAHAKKQLKVARTVRRPTISSRKSTDIELYLNAGRQLDAIERVACE